MRRVLAVILPLLLLLSGCAKVPETHVEPLTLYAIKAGKADAFVLSCGGKTMLLDTAEEEDGEKIAQVLQVLREDRLDVLLISHYDKDHVGGAPYLLERVQVGTIIDPDYETDSAAMQAYLSALEEVSAARLQPDEPIEFSLGDALVRVYPTNLTEAEENDRSLITTVTHGNVTFLFPGDAQKDRLAEWLTEHKEKFTFLKAPHHGNWNSMSKIFYLTVEPEICVVTASEKNPADEETLSILNNLNTQIYLTQNGTVAFVSDGKQILSGE